MLSLTPPRHTSTLPTPVSWRGTKRLGAIGTEGPLEVSPLNKVALVHRHRPRPGCLRIFGSRDLPHRGPGELWPALSRSRRRGEYFRRIEEPMGWAASSPTTWRVAVWPRASSRCFTIGGTSSFVWPSRIGIEKPSPAGRCCCTPSPNGCAMRERPPSKSPAPMPARFPPPRRFAPSPCSCAAWPKMRSG